MAGFAAVVVVLSIIALIAGILQKMKAGRVAGAPLAKTGDAASKGKAVAGEKGAISVEGNVICQQPVMAPFSGTPCLFFEIKTTATWKDGETTKSKELHKEKHAAPFWVDDGSGPVAIDAREGGDFEPETKREETKGTGLIAGITGKDLEFGNYRVSTGFGALGTKYTVVERCLPMQQRLYVCGKVADAGGAISSPSWRQLVISNKSRDELLAHSMKTSKMLLIGGGAGMLVGIILGVISRSMAPSPDATTAAAPTSSAAAATTANAATTVAGAAPTAAAVVVPAKGPIQPGKGPGPAKASAKH